MRTRFAFASTLWRHAPKKPSKVTQDEAQTRFAEQQRQIDAMLQEMSNAEEARKTVSVPSPASPAAAGGIQLDNTVDVIRGFYQETPNGELLAMWADVVPS